MKTRTVSIVKHPPELVWRTMRDRLPEIARLVEDIESVTASSKETDPAGAVHIVNIWQARPKLPAVVVSHVRADMLAWTDRSVWPAKKFECAWRIEPHFFAERIDCRGVTRYEPAMGRRGTRITFDGDLDILIADLPGVPPALENVVAQAIKSILGGLIPKNFRRIVEAMAAMLDNGKVQPR